MRSYESKGIICVKDKFNFTYYLCEITYILNEDETYKYIFKPNYNVIDLLDADLFQGIPGLNIDLRKNEYIRENILPTFISERVPSDNREDYYELLEKVSMEYMDPIQYLIRTDQRYSGDNLFVVGYKEKETIAISEGLRTNNVIIKQILENICKGNDVVVNNQLIDDSNRKAFYNVFYDLYSKAYKNNKILQSEGIKKAKSENKYKGRKPKQVDELKFIELLDKVNRKELKPKEAAKILNISIDKYYRLKKLQN